MELALMGCDTVHDNISYNPKCVSVSYSQDSDFDPDGKGGWLPAKRVFCPMEVEELEVLLISITYNFFFEWWDSIDEIDHE